MQISQQDQQDQQMQQMSTTNSDQEKSTEMLIQSYNLSSELRSQLCRSIHIKVKQVQNPINKDLCLEIETFTILNDQPIKRVTRKAKQIDLVEQHLYQQYGGHVIPVLAVDLYFRQGDYEQQQWQTKVVLDQVEAYFNHISKDFYCSGDNLVFELFFNSQFIVQEQASYEKVLSKAATYSRKYLNSIFARKQLHKTSNPFAEDILNNYAELKEFSKIFRSFYELISNSISQTELIDDLFSELGQLCNQAVSAISDNPYLSANQVSQVQKLYRMLIEAEESYKRWQELNEKVRQVQADVNKGLMHEDSSELKEREQKLRHWTKSLAQQYEDMVVYGQQLMDRISTKYSQNKRHQYVQNIQLFEAVQNARLSVLAERKNSLQTKREENQKLVQRQKQVVLAKIAQQQTASLQNKQAKVEISEKSSSEDAETNSQDVVNLANSPVKTLDNSCDNDQAYQVKGADTTTSSQKTSQQNLMCH